MEKLRCERCGGYCMSPTVGTFLFFNSWKWIKTIKKMRCHNQSRRNPIFIWMKDERKGNWVTCRAWATRMWCSWPRAATHLAKRVCTLSLTAVSCSAFSLFSSASRAATLGFRRKNSSQKLGLPGAWSSPWTDRQQWGLMRNKFKTCAKVMGEY